MPSGLISTNAYITKSSKNASTLVGSPKTYVPTNLFKSGQFGLTGIIFVGESI